MENIFTLLSLLRTFMDFTWQAYLSLKIKDSEVNKFVKKKTNQINMPFNQAIPDVH